jgi:putative hydrolase of HD superfamily
MKEKRAKTAGKNIVHFIFETGMLKQVPRSGWSVLGIKNAESVAEHSFRCAAIGYLLARMERIPPYKVMLMTLFGDMQEARITDLHKMAQRYIDAQAVEDASFQEQVDVLPKRIGGELDALRKEYSAQRTKESIIARDADILECLIQAKEYYEQGHRQAAQFMRKAPVHLKTRNARKLWQTAKRENISDWWFRLSEFKR